LRLKHPTSAPGQNSIGTDGHYWIGANKAWRPALFAHQSTVRWRRVGFQYLPHYEGLLNPVQRLAQVLHGDLVTGMVCRAIASVKTFKDSTQQMHGSQVGERRDRGLARCIHDFLSTAFEHRSTAVKDGTCTTSM
jgi:hypothetical protein